MFQLESSDSNEGISSSFSSFEFSSSSDFQSTILVKSTSWFQVAQDPISSTFPFASFLLDTVSHCCDWLPLLPVFGYKQSSHWTQREINFCMKKNTLPMALDENDNLNITYLECLQFWLGKNPVLLLKHPSRFDCLP